MTNEIHANSLSFSTWMICWRKQGLWERWWRDEGWEGNLLFFSLSLHTTLLLDVVHLHRYNPLVCSSPPSSQDLVLVVHVRLFLVSSPTQTCLFFSFTLWSLHSLRPSHLALFLGNLARSLVSREEEDLTFVQKKMITLYRDFLFSCYTRMTQTKRSFTLHVTLGLFPSFSSSSSTVSSFSFIVSSLLFFFVHNRQESKMKAERKTSKFGAKRKTEKRKAKKRDQSKEKSQQLFFSWFLV